MTRRDYPPIKCDRHGSAVVFLVDVVGDDGTITQACPRCVPLVQVDVVRALYRAAMKGAVQ